MVHPSQRRVVSRWRARSAWLCLLVLVALYGAGPARSADSVGLVEHEGEGESRVAGGRPVNPRSYPWTAQLKLPGNNLCGGALISCSTVVTAAHCIEPFSKSAILSDGTVFLGNPRKDTGRTFGIADVFVHPKYNKDGFDSSSGETIHNDIAVITLDSPSDIRPVRLPRNDPRVGARGFVLGWGETESSSTSPILREAALQVMPRDACDSKTGKQYFDPSSSFCTGSGKPRPPRRKHTRPLRSDGRASACQGDSGGPFVDSKSKQLWGIISYAFASEAGASSCGDEGRQTVVTSVSGSLDFIRDHMKDDTCRPPHQTDYQEGSGGEKPPRPPKKRLGTI